jgi:peptidoglycan hydrolase-like protein with peptidoglycan-binding domain
MGYDLKGKTVENMTPDEVGALTDGLAKAEYWKPGTVQQTPPPTDEQLRTALAARPHQAVPEHAHDAHPNSHRQGDHGGAVGQLQSDLAALGVTARDGSPIQPDQRFGPHTREAVEAFQQAHGLHADGIAGPATLAAISEAKTHVHTDAQTPVPDMLDARHPANGIYVQAYACVAKLDEAQGREPGAHAQAFAGSLTSAATAAGFSRVDHVALSDDANRGYAIQGDLNSPFKRYVEVDVMQAIQTPLAQSSQEAATHVQNNVQQQAQAQQQSQQAAPDVAQQGGPAMTR